MAKIRIGLGSEFNLNNGNLGLGVTNPQVRLDVDGTVKSKDFEVTGVTSFTAYEGFLRSDHQIDGDLTLNTGQGLNASLSGEIIIKDGTTVTVGAIGLGTTSVGVGTELITNTIDSNAVNLAGGSEIECLKVYNTFTPPSGGTNQRPYAPKPGELYYNYDLKTIEFHDGYGWRQVDNTTTTGRMLIAGGYGPASPNAQSLIDYVNISSTGNAVNFAELDATQYDNGGCANSIRGLAAGNAPYADVIEYVTMASGGKGIDFGNLTQGRRLNGSGMANSNRGVFAGGRVPYSPNDTNIIDTVNIMTIGNAVDFGDMSVNRRSPAFTFASPTKALVGGGKDSNSIDFAHIDVINICSGGDSTQFPDIITAREQGAGSCNQTKGVFAGGTIGPTTVNNIESITISTLGNSVEFGNLSVKVRQLMSAGSHTRGVFAGGKDPSNYNTISYVNISSSGDALDFGDLTLERHAAAGFSDSHGGLGGF